MKEGYQEVSRILTAEQQSRLAGEVISQTLAERPSLSSSFDQIENLISNGIELIQKFEKMTIPHPKIFTDTDVVYIDSGPGPIDPDLLKPGEVFPDFSYHPYHWTQKMDRARVKTGYTLANLVASKRIVEQTGRVKSPRELTREDYHRFGPYLMYTSTDWQNQHFTEAVRDAEKSGRFIIPDHKIITYSKFTTEQNEEKEIAHTEDQIQGLKFPRNSDGSNPKRIAIVSHPAHLLRILHILGKYPDKIPEGSKLQLFPIPTPVDGVYQYAKMELLGTIATIYEKNRASLAPYSNFE